MAAVVRDCARAKYIQVGKGKKVNCRRQNVVQGELLKHNAKRCPQAP